MKTAQQYTAATLDKMLPDVLHRAEVRALLEAYTQALLDDFKTSLKPVATVRPSWPANGEQEHRIQVDAHWAQLAPGCYTVPPGIRS